MAETKCDEKDAMSTLSDDLLIEILSLTKSYKSAVLCSAISKRFTGLYQKLPCMHFREEDLLSSFYKNFLSKEVDDDTFVTEDEHLDQHLDIETKDSLAKSLVSAILDHEEKIHTFSLRGTVANFDLWKDCLAHLILEQHQQIEHLSVVLWERRPVFFPSCIFSCASLVTLEMRILCLHSIPGTFQGFPNLRNCKLALDIYVDGDVEVFNSLLPRCPVLRILDVTIDFLDTECRLPLVLSSESLLNLDIYLIHPEEAVSYDALKVVIDTPELLTMTLDSDNSPCYFVTVQAYAPKLSELSIPAEYVKLFMNEFPEEAGLEGILNAKWRTNDHCLTSFRFIDSSEATDKSILSMISCHKALEVLELSNIFAHPAYFQRMLASLPMLEKLTLTDCYFKDKDKQKYRTRGSCNMSSLTEICLTNYTQDCLGGEREMVSSLLQISPNLRILRFIITCRRMACKKEYAEMLGEVLSKGDYLNLKESSEQVEFSIFRKRIL